MAEGTVNLELQLFSGYQEFVGLTCNPQLTTQERLGNVVTGLTGEVAETLELIVHGDPGEDITEKLHKEIGDILWYTALGFSVIGKNLAHRVQGLSDGGNSRPLIAVFIDLSIAAGAASDIVKKHLYQAHTLKEDKLYEQLTITLQYIAQAAYITNTNLAEIAQKNMDKLKARYPEGHFSAERSINRVKEE